MIDVEEIAETMTDNEVEEYLPRFILIDDDPVANVIAEMAIKMSIGSVPIKTFVDGNAALGFIKSFPSTLPKPTIIFLDLNMPTISGWEFLEYFDRFEDNLKVLFNIYILSSSVDQRDKERSDNNINVRGYYIKPISKETVLQIYNGS